jgi:2-polyprenyl-3-methyl-5-hydroxy-6-metoxy-1,4-benzoquinol methylase
MTNRTGVSLDATGEETLIAFSKANAFNAWLSDLVLPWSKGHILEIGSGIGNISEIILQNNLTITLSDLNVQYCSQLKNKFENRATCRGIISLDIGEANFEEKHKTLLTKFDTIIALNVIEHIEDDRKAFENCKKLLVPGGRIIILVPAFTFLYNSFDKELGHYRRYTRNELSDKMQHAGFNVIHSQYFNMPAMFGWFISGSLFKMKIIPEKQLNFYNYLVPLFKRIDALFQKKIGISLIMVAEVN